MAEDKDAAGKAGTSILDMVRHENINVRMTVWWWLLCSLSDGILIAGVVAAYLYKLSGESNMAVGYAEGIFGAMSLGPGIAGGIWSDKHRRDRVIRASGVCTLVGVLCMLILVVLVEASSSIEDHLMLDSHTHLGTWKFIAACICVIMIYAGEGLSMAASQAILADSLTTGDRMQFLGTLSTWQNVFSGIGPIICLVVFVGVGDTWSVRNLQYIAAVGLVLRIPICPMCFFFDDDKCLGHESEALVTETEEVASRFTAFKYKMVPYIYFASDITWCFGSGMTVKFFTIFFLDDKKGLGLGPIIVSAVVAVVPLLAAVSTELCLRLVKYVGRVQVDLLFWYAGVSCLLAISLMGFNGDYGTSLKTRILVITLYLARCALLRGPSSIQQSIIMDFVPKKTRARWASLDIISQAGWCGSAAVGGVLIHKYSYELAFLVTCCLHILSTIIRLPLLNIVPRHEVKVPAKPSSALTLLFLHAGLADPNREPMLSEADTQTLREYMLPALKLEPTVNIQECSPSNNTGDDDDDGDDGADDTAPLLGSATTRGCVNGN